MVLFIFQNFMKKYLSLLWLTALLSFISFWLTTNAAYDLQIDENNNEVYLLSGDTQITLDNLNDYITWLDSDLNLWLITTWAELSWDNTNPTNWSWSEINTWSTEWTGPLIDNPTWSWSEVDNPESSTWATVDTWTQVSTWTERILWENINAELSTWDEFDKALYRMYMNWLTKYDNADEFRPYDNLTREESAKMIWQLYSQLWFSKEDKWFNCSFVDTNMFDPTLAEHIYNVCRRWIFRWNDKTQQYMPHDNLTKWQLLAVLLRIFEWKMSEESGEPRWIEYYVKAMTLWLTNETNLSKFDKPVTRWEAWLLIYRFKNMVIDQTEYELYLARLESLASDNESYLKQLEDFRSQRSWNQTTWSNNETTTDTSNPDSNWITTASWSVAESWSSVSLDIIAWNETLTNSPEFIEAINWMYDMWMTSYNTTEAFMPYQTITRAQVAKMLDKFAIATNLTEIRNFGTCEFSDVASWSEYKDAITRVCQYWIMAWSNDKFSPDKTVSKAEFVAMLIRLFDGKTLDETLNPWWTAYYKRAIEIWLISAQDTVTFTADIARYEVATYLYRLKVRLTMYNNLNSSQLSDEIVKTLDETQATNDQWKVSAKVYVDILALNNSAFNDGYVEIIWQRYRIKKVNTSSYNVWANSFVRYWTLYNIESWDAIGSISFILTNGALVEGSVRIDKNSYYLTKDSNTTTYYNVTQI